MTDRFNALLRELGQILGVPLHTDRHNACAIKIKERLKVQIQIDPEQEKLLIVAKLSELPPGKFREEVLKKGLQENNLPDPRIGTFSYLSAAHALILYERHPVDLLNGEKLASFLIPFIALAEKWNDAILSGQLHRLLH